MRSSGQTTREDTRIFTVVSLTCQSPLIHVEVDSMFNRSSIKPPLDLEPVKTKEPLHTSNPLELLFTAPVRRAPNLSQNNTGPSHKLHLRRSPDHRHQAV